MSDLKERIQDLISEGKTEEALELLKEISPSEAVLLQSRYSSVKRSSNMGMIDFGEWARNVAQINYAILELAQQAKKTAESRTGQAAESKGEAASAPKIFISYSHADMLAMRAVKGFLEANDLRVHVDLNDLNVGDSIQGFIDEALKNNDYVISIISKNSLKSGWVSKELVVAKFHGKTKSNWIPVSIDGAWHDNQFFFEAIAEIDQKTSDCQANIKKAIDGNLDISPFTDELKRLQDLKANIGSTVGDLKNVLVVDVSGQMFELGMKKVLDKIANAR